MCPDAATGIKTKAQIKYDNKMDKYNANKEKKAYKDTIVQHYKLIDNINDYQIESK
jgi:hypothetical protein